MCEETCREDKKTTGNVTPDTTFKSGEVPVATDRGDIPPGLGEIQEGRHPKLCPGPNRTIESEDESGLV